jgi:predicted ABC-type ATPase
MASRTTTLELHTVDGRLSEERTRLHARLVRDIVSGTGERTRLEAVLYAGGPASGKTSLLERMGPSKADGFVGLNPDAVRERLPEYREWTAAGDLDAAVRTQAEASMIAKIAADAAIDLRKSLFIDAVGWDDRGQFSSTIHRLLDLGYAVTVRYATVPVALAREREAKRARDTGRKVPPEVLTDGHREVSRGFQRVARIPGIRIEVYDMSGAEPELIAEGIGDADAGAGGLTVHDTGGYHRFLEKANE